MKWVRRLTLALVLWLSGVAIWIWAEPSQNPDIDTGDVAIVLGAAVDDDVPSPVFAARIDHAIDLLKGGLVSELIFTGGQSPEDRMSEAAAARDYAIAAGVPASMISIEEVSRTTHQNLTEASAIMQSIGANDALIVSDPLHLRRALVMAEDLGIEAKASATSKTRYRSWSTKAPFLAREVYFIHHYWVFGE